MHKNLDGLTHAGPEKENVTVYRTINLFAPDRFIWFFAYTPHLMKTIRNCIYQSSKCYCYAKKTHLNLMTTRQSVMLSEDKENIPTAL